MPVNESSNDDLSVGASAATSNNLGMLTQTGEIAIEQSNVNLNSQFLGPQPPDMTVIWGRNTKHPQLAINYSP
jgi:hypothetical protein